MHNLDVDIQEYFEFQLKGYTYHFRQPTTEEVQLFAKVDTQDTEKSNAFLFQFITPVNDAPPFEEISKQMLIPHWRKFREMIEQELGVN